MNLRSVVAVSVVALAAAACGPQESSPATALVEELSVGVDPGADACVNGPIRGKSGE